MIYATLHVRLSDGQTLSYDIEKEIVTIGRAPENDLILNDATVAPQHARLTVQPGQLAIQDLGSLGGTTLDGARIDAEKEYSLMRVNAIRLGSVDAILGAPNSAPPAWPSPTAATQPTARPFTLALTPKRSTRDFTVTVTRNSNPLPSTKIILAGRDATESMAFTFKPQTLRIEAGESKTALLEVRGNPGAFTVSATAEGSSLATKGQLLAVNRLPIILTSVIAVSILLGVLLVLGSCPTVFSDVCSFVPANPISLAFSTATFTPTNTRTSTATFTSTVIVTPTAAAASGTSAATSAVVVTPTPTFTSTPTAKFEGGVLTYKLLQANGTYSLMALPPVGNPITLLANKTDMRVLDYSRAKNIFAIEVLEANRRFLWLVSGEGKVVREAINDGWEKINEGDFAPDATYFLLEATINDQPRYYFYNLGGDLVRTFIPQAPTQTPLPTRTPLPTNTSTVTPTPSRTLIPSITPTTGVTPAP